jgi:cytidine deaminase
LDSKTSEKLIEMALKARANAYVPYSGYRVGAAVLVPSGEIFTGCNIENASYSLTNCAERTAIFKAVSEGHTEFEGMAVAVDGNTAAAPCGACRQVIQEFFANTSEIILVNEAGEGGSTTIVQLLPGAFTKHNF